MIIFTFLITPYQQKTSFGWREILIDVDEDEESSNDLRFVISPAPTPASNTFVQVSVPLYS